MDQTLCSHMGLSLFYRSHVGCAPTSGVPAVAAIVCFAFRQQHGTAPAAGSLGSTNNLYRSLWL